jgi:hypothetical protein
VQKRTLVILGLICAIVCAQWAPLVSTHSHRDSSQHFCWLCHFSSLPCVQSAVSVSLAPDIYVAWLERSAGFEAPHEVLLLARYSRGPPA